ncbi:hypothetical protein GCM10011409_33000 [Lentibacillus populi]|uniref:Endonuclease/exonuclease/phosphatase domain-containing protein n=1 Tax=Lentibacillus populi TaxID=1827502 RepID=A0A9W5X6I0_9BACI|nr:hypothetical protein [Lentibacillus populi]GGB52826.1 hypothetical protein GCM10011409_33000 [Lentibacillus populi]
MDLEGIAKVIKDAGADVIGIQEVDRFYGDRSDFQDQIKKLAELLSRKKLAEKNTIFSASFFHYVNF